MNVAAPSRAAAARHPVLEPVGAIVLLMLAIGLAMLGMEALAIRELGAYVVPSLHLAIFFVGYDLATGSVLLWAASRRLRLDREALGGMTSATAPPPDAPPAISVLIAAYNEASADETRGIVGTVREVAAQRGVDVEVLVGDDGSEDDTYGDVVRAFGLVRGDEGHEGSLPGSHATATVVRVFRFPHAGKGATLNALAKRASHGVLVTMDADTSPAEGALAHLAAAFADPAVESAAGVVTVRNAGSTLTRHQYAEYVKNSIVRIGWSALGALEQVPGAFAGVRTASFLEVQGFPTDSLVEDYELTYRLIERGRRLGRVPVVVTVPRAQAFTDVPVSLRGFVRQRTRWFAGFLSTLFRFKHLIARPGTGAFGLVRLPLKLIDAVLPLIAFGSLAVILRGASSSILPVSRVALGIFAVRWLWDLFFYGASLHLSRELGEPLATQKAAPGPVKAWLCTATEALTYVWLKHASTLRAFTWALRRVRTWEPSREHALPAASRPVELAAKSVGAMVGSAPCAPPSVQR